MQDVQATLDSIGVKFGTDKASFGHNYLAFYERFFAPLRFEPITVLEIGVFRGASLRTWHEYFPSARIIGMDIDLAARAYAGDRIQIELADQANVQDLVDLGVKHGPFDIIIEDGSHIWDHQINTLRCLFPFLSPHGYYIVEDLQTNYGGHGANYRGASDMTCVEYLKRMLDLRVGNSSVDITAEEDLFLRTYGRSVEFMAFHSHACLLQKDFRKVVRGTDDLIATPLTEIAEAHGIEPVRLMAHIGYIGDVANGKAGYVNIPLTRGLFFQGFQVMVGSAMAAKIECRGRRSNGVWTEWIKGNAFVGSRGTADNLTGLAVRLLDDLAEALDVHVAAAFGREQGVVMTRNGADCVAASGPLPLRGVQVSLTRKPS